MMTLDVNSFEELFKGSPPPPEGEVNSTMMSSACHPNAPFYAVYMQGSGRAGLRCSCCGQVWGELLIAKSLIAHVPPATLGRKLNGAG